ncbi:MAG: lytic murein transglycosylase [Hyphomicrobiaceae bacterium]
MRFATLLPAAALLVVTFGGEAGAVAPGGFKENSRDCRNTGSFSSWLSDFRKTAEAEGISRRTIGRALDGVSLDDGVIRRDRRQGFFAQGFLSFQKRLATNSRVSAGRKKIQANRTFFDRAEKQYGVPPEVITGFWALESDFGAGMGNLPVLRSLVTLAYDCRRGEMFTEELKAALKIIDRGDLDPEDMIGSWAGELGQTQFLPTRYLEFALDYDGDRHANLFRSDADIIGSTANYMKHLGWRAGEPWIEEVKITGDLPWKEADLAIKHPRSAWVKWGIERRSGDALPADNMPASLLLPMGRDGPAFLAYDNFGVYLQWNQSLNYATTAAYLATRIAGAPVMSSGRGAPQDLSDEQTKELQRLLTKRGYDVGTIDGLVGEKTRAAVKDMQIKLDQPADSFPTPELLSALRRM